MLQKLLKQFNIFSSENWWIYILLAITVLLVFLTGKGNMLEIIVLFSINLCGAMFNMLMMSAYKNKHFSEGSVFIVIANMLYTGLSLYAWLHDGDMQYIFWQLSFLLVGFKAFALYTYDIHLKYINFYSIFILNILVMWLLVWYIGLSYFAIVQSSGIALITLGLALRNDELRYFLVTFWNFFVVAWSLCILWENYLSGNILWITVAYTLLWLSTFVYYLKLLPLYISRYKNI